MNFFNKLSPVYRDELGYLRRKLYFFSFCDEFILIYPLYTLMFQSHGLTGAQISSLLIALSAIIFVLQVPAGSIADIFSRRLVLTTAVIVRALAFACWLLFPNYIGFLVGFLLWGVKRAFVSGTLESFIFDELKRLGCSNEYTYLTGRMQTYALLGFILGGLSAGALASFGYPFILLCSIVAVCMSAVAIYSLPSISKAKGAQRTPYVQTLKVGVRIAFDTPVVLFIVSIGAVVNGLRVVDEYYGLFFHELRFDNQLVAFWVAGIYVFDVLGSLTVNMINPKRVPISLVLIMWAALLGLSAMLPASLAPISLGLFGAMYYAMSVLLNAYLQHEMADEARATATSVMSFVAEFFSLAVYCIFALTSGKGYVPGLQIIAALIACFGIMFGMATRIYRRLRW